MRTTAPATAWHLVSPLHVVPGTAVRLENLPAGEFEVRAFHPAARGRPERVLLDPLHPLSLELRMIEPAPGEASQGCSLRTLLSSTGLGTLPRLQPLVEIGSTRENAQRFVSGTSEP